MTLSDESLMHQPYCHIYDRDDNSRFKEPRRDSRYAIAISRASFILRYTVTRGDV